MTFKKHEPHTGAPIRVGHLIVFAAGGAALSRQPDSLDEYDVLIPLADSFPELETEDHVVVECHLPDFGGVPDDWREILERQIIPTLQNANKYGLRTVCYCHAGHGRTGTLLASLIALLESLEETPDPISAVRVRYCEGAVETHAQAEGIFALRGQGVPEGHQFHH